MKNTDIYIPDKSKKMLAYRNTLESVPGSDQY